MYVNGMVIFAESADELHAIVNTLKSYATIWNHTVDVEKTRIVIYKNEGK